MVSSIYRRRYEVAGYEVEAALDGEAGWTRILKFKPDLVQLDLMIPRLNGLEIIKRVRAHPTLKGLPILVLSNCYVSDMVREAWKAGANKCISKQNCSPDLVLDTIQELLNPSAPPFAGPLPSSAANPVAQVSDASLVPSTTPAAAKTPETRESGGGTTWSETRHEFLARVPQIQADLRHRLHALVKSGDAARLALLGELFQSVRSLASYAGITGFVRISHLAGALEALLKELQSKPPRLTASSLRTIAQCVDGLSLLFGETARPPDESPPSALILAVDDEPISRQTLCLALSKAYLKALCMDDPNLALAVLAQNQFDLIFLDVDMPGIDGLELCRRLRLLPTNKGTPIVFVTSLSDFDSRARSTLSGGNDFIAKPFLLMELAVKALTFLIKAGAAAGATTSPVMQTASRPGMWAA